jgi:hypothetical protein
VRSRTSAQTPWIHPESKIRIEIQVIEIQAVEIQAVEIQAV